ncbi:SDR family oxidoreductase [Glycocaulis profundi]|nr:SDR family oxidoreductase [Glycocaulis profundi]
MAKKQDRGAALVTGGAKRVGAAFIEALAASGHDVVIHYRSSAAEAEALAKKVRKKKVKAVTLDADLSDPAMAGALIERAQRAIGPVSVLVNSASIFEDDEIGSVTAESFNAHMQANALAPLLLSQAFARQAPAGSMIFNVLDYKLFNINADYFSYTVSKAALKTMTEMLARALAPKVRVNAVAPGLTLPSPYHSEAEFERLHDDNPLGHGPTPEELAAALVYFLDAPAVSGQILCVDGGQHFDPRLTKDVFGALKG